MRTACGSHSGAGRNASAGFDEGLEDDASVELKGLEPVASVDLLRHKWAAQLHPLNEASAACEEPANKRVGVERMNADRVPFVEQEHGVAVDLPREEFVRSGPSHHRQVDEQEFARSRETIKLLVNPGGRGPR